MSPIPIKPAAGPKTIVWIASYPKSGNTWMRAFLANYLVDNDGPLPLDAIGQVSPGDSAAKRYLEVTGKTPGHIAQPEQMEARQEVLMRIARRADVNLVKTHNINGRAVGAPMIPPGVTRLGVHVVRNPLDMVLSYSDHFALDHAGAAEAIASPRNIVPPNIKTVRQFLGNWSDHTRSWADARAFPVITVRYEDMLDAPEDTFASVLQAIGAPVDPDILADAIAASSFDTLSRLESETGYGSKGVAQEKFFRVGRKDTWKTELAAEIADRIRSDHAEMMARFGYL